MLYFSQLTLNPRSRQVQHELRDPYQMHRSLARAFGDDDQFTAARVLFRVEEDTKDGLPRVLVQSLRPPDWAVLEDIERYLAGLPRMKEFDPAFAVGQALSFRLRANPTVKRSRKQEGKRQGRREGIYHEEERLAWLARKGEQSGFRVLAVVTRGLGREVAKQHDDGTPFKIPQVQCRLDEQRLAAFSAVQFDGTLVVSDPAALRKALESGIGSGKGFGFGLLSVARTGG
ncbi:MAG: type I-E CRISPR-associated protein Cas6/Cse3/CasE [Armatimonadota bacterium]|nr:type I-E CRISPR-associated protein Cas6/Cse3/CasE [Armatimonadota bacterium]